MKMSKYLKKIITDHQAAFSFVTLFHARASAMRVRANGSFVRPGACESFRLPQCAQMIDCASTADCASTGQTHTFCRCSSAAVATDNPVHR